MAREKSLVSCLKYRQGGNLPSYFVLVGPDVLVLLVTKVCVVKNILFSFFLLSVVHRHSYNVSIIGIGRQTKKKQNQHKQKLQSCIKWSHLDSLPGCFPSLTFRVLLLKIAIVSHVDCLVISSVHVGAELCACVCRHWQGCLCRPV